MDDHADDPVAKALKQSDDSLKSRIQTWSAILTSALAAGMIIYSLVAKIATIESEIAIIRERQNVNTENIAKFTGPGPRFTRVDGDKLQHELDKVVDRVRIIEGKVLIIEDRASRPK